MAPTDHLKKTGNLEASACVMPSRQGSSLTSAYAEAMRGARVAKAAGDFASPRLKRAAVLGSRHAADAVAGLLGQK